MPSLESAACFDWETLYSTTPASVLIIDNIKLPLTVAGVFWNTFSMLKVMKGSTLRHIITVLREAFLKDNREVASMPEKRKGTTIHLATSSQLLHVILRISTRSRNTMAKDICRSTSRNDSGKMTAATLFTMFMRMPPNTQAGITSHIEAWSLVAIQRKSGMKTASGHIAFDCSVGGTTKYDSSPDLPTCASTFASMVASLLLSSTKLTPWDSSTDEECESVAPTGSSSKLAAPLDPTGSCSATPMGLRPLAGASSAAHSHRRPSRRTARSIRSRMCIWRRQYSHGAAQ
mmetsp:Transcript_70426/g.186902  ORF Transcript_70426/g.186902 Transcript_70426/m.186902 type:complete len:289 (-) Transcript_70426:12-878(-)